MIDHDKFIASQAVMKSLLESGRMTGDVAADQEYIRNMFPWCLKEMEAYASKPEILPKPLSNFTPPPEIQKEIEGLGRFRGRLIFVGKKEYKPKKFRYLFKDENQTWYSSFFQNHFDVGEEAKIRKKEVEIIFEKGEYNGKPQYTVQSIEILKELREHFTDDLAESVES